MGLTPEILDMFCKFMFTSSLKVPSNFCVRDTQMRRDPNSHPVHRESKPLCHTPIFRQKSHVHDQVPRQWNRSFFILFLIVHLYCHTLIWLHYTKPQDSMSLSLSLIFHQLFTHTHTHRHTDTDTHTHTHTHTQTHTHTHTHTQGCLNIKQVRRK